MSWTIGRHHRHQHGGASHVHPRDAPFKRMQLLVDSVNRIVRETLNGLQVIRAFNTQHMNANGSNKQTPN
jgi:hypothetical protein